MKRMMSAVLSFASLVILSPLAKADCFTDGYSLGQTEAEAFCSMWERMYNDDAVVYPYRAMSWRLCNQQLVAACKEGMAQHTRDNFPLCTALVRSGWRNSQGESARLAWAQWQRGACTVVTP